jgi:hypothetical protein
MLTLIDYIFNFIKTFAVGILFDEYLQTNYPEIREKYKNAFINQSYNAVYLYSKLQITLNKYKPYMNKLINDYPLLKKLAGYDVKSTSYNIEFIVDGNVVYKTTKEKIFDNSYNQEYNGEFDFIIYSEYNTINDNENNILHRKILKSLPKEEKDFQCDKSDVKFVWCEFSVGDKKFKVDFKNSTSNYYVVDNVLDVKFLKYFLQKYYSEHIQDIDFNLTHDFKINILDHNIESIVLDKQSNIKFSKENYELVKQ